KVKDGNNVLQIQQALKKAKAERKKPSLIIVNTTIGYGSPNKAGSADVHGAPLGAEEIKLTKANLGWNDKEDFYIPEDVKKHVKDIIANKIKEEETWNEKYQRYQTKYPQLAKQWEEFHE